MELSDPELIARILAGDTDSFEPLIARHQAKVFATVRRYARRESEVEDLVQDIFLRAFQKLPTYRAEAPFEHWLMRLTMRICYTALRGHQRNREMNFTELSRSESDWLDRFVTDPTAARDDESAARLLLDRLLGILSPKSRLVVTLLELEERSVKEIAELTGWSVSHVKVRAFRARAEMRKALAKLGRSKYL